MQRTTHIMNIEAIRERARQHMERGAVTESYGADRDVAIQLLNDALATELVCVLRYKRHYFMASGIHAEAAAAEFSEHAAEEQEHADRIAARIVQLGGEPDFSPHELVRRSHSEYVEGRDLIEMIRENLVAERIAIESYTEMVRFFGTKDPTSRVLIESILATEEEHADDMSSLLQGVLPPEQPTRGTQSSAGRTSAKARGAQA